MSNQEYDSWSRRHFLSSVILAGTGALLGLRPNSVAAEPPPETTTLRVRSWRPACWAPIHVAEPLLREEGFTDVQYVSGPGTKAVKMLQDGAIDLTPSFVALDMVNVEKNKHPLTFLAGMHVGCYALFGSKRITSIHDLKGKTVWTGAVEGGGPHLFFSAIVAYVGLNPHTDITYAWVKKDKAMSLFHEGKIDAFMSFPPGPQELMDKNVGHLLVDTNVDRPWSQYFCCMVSGHSEFIKKNPIATRRALRAILKANDLVARDPEQAMAKLLSKKIRKESEKKYVLQALKEIPYGKWRAYNPEDTIRFYALRLRDIGMIKSSPKEFEARNTDWRFLRGLKKELNLEW